MDLHISIFPLPNNSTIFVNLQNCIPLFAFTNGLLHVAGAEHYATKPPHVTDTQEENLRNCLLQFLLLFLRSALAKLHSLAVSASRQLFKRKTNKQKNKTTKNLHTSLVPKVGNIYWAEPELVFQISEIMELSSISRI